MIGEVVGSYRITEKIATGGMGVVYRAEHDLIGKTAAVKVLRREYSENRDIMDRFFREAQATTSIRHPGIIDIYDFGYYQDDRAYIVMELLEGETLKERLRARGVLSPEAAIRMIRSVAGAVGAAHDQGVVHRDLKPDNIFLVPDPDMPDGERIKVLDFGLAKLTDGHNATMGTQAGILLGTPAYMAPEQCSGEGQIDARADLYALGCILFQLVCGRPPFVHSTSMTHVLMAHLRDAPPLPRTLNGAVPESLEHIILKLLAKAPEQRFQTMAELRQALDACAAEVFENPMAVRIAPTGGHAAVTSQVSARISGAYVSQTSTLGASAGQMMEGHHGSHVSHASHASHASATGSSQRMATHMSRDSGMHGSGQHTSGARRERQTPSRSGVIRWVLGGAASILLGMGLVLALAPNRLGRPAATTPEELAVHAQPAGDGAGRAGAGQAGAGASQTGAGQDTAGAVPATEVGEGEPEDVRDNGAEAGADSGDDLDEDEPPIEMGLDVLGSAPVKVRLVIEPSTSTVLVDGELRTENPLQLVPRDKAYRIEVQAQGFQTKKRWVQADRDRVVRIELEPTKIDLNL